MLCDLMLCVRGMATTKFIDKDALDKSVLSASGGAMILVEQDVIEETGHLDKKQITQ